MRIIVAITGASGTIYARQLIDALVERGVQVGVIVSSSATEVAKFECQQSVLNNPNVTYYSNDDFFTPPASGSGSVSALVVVPCSMGTLGRIATGVSENLICRCADVMLKERRKLILVTREMPLNLIHIRNMSTVTECGGIIVPASPSFYGGAQDVEQLCMSVTNRVLSLLNFNNNVSGWCE